MAVLAADLPDDVLTADKVLWCIDAFDNVPHVGNEESFATLTLVIVSYDFIVVAECLVAVQTCAFVVFSVQILDVGQAHYGRFKVI